VVVVDGWDGGGGRRTGGGGDGGVDGWERRKPGG
jgi:hypothetical protein